MPDISSAAMSARAPPRWSACRCCGAPADETFVDLGLIADATAARRDDSPAPEPFRRLHAVTCSDCRLVQLAGPEPTQRAGCPRTRPEQPHHAAQRDAAAIATWLRLHAGTEVLSIGEEHATLSAFAARGIPTGTVAPGDRMARRLRAAGREPVLLLAGDMFARVTDLHDLLAGLRTLLAPGGVLIAQVVYLPRLMQAVRFDGLCHDRLSWFTLATAEIALAQHGLVVFDAEEVAAEGGSLRLFARHVEDRGKPVTEAVEMLRRREAAAGLGRAEAYRGFAAQVAEAKCALLDFLVGVRRAGRRVAGHVACGSGNTLLGYCGVGPELLPFVVDEDVRRQGLLLPGVRIPVRPPGAILCERPDFVLLLDAGGVPDVTETLGAIRDWGGRFVLPGPGVEVF